MSEKILYMHGRATPDLESFTNNLFLILTGAEPLLNWRTQATQRWYVNFKKNLGEERITRQIGNRMLGHTMALLENDFPYDGIMPLGGYEEHSGSGLEHYCLFSKEDSLLVPRNIDRVIEVNFTTMPALIFMHDDANTSIKGIKHAHIVVDLGYEKARLKRRYFDTKNFIYQ